MPNRPYNETIAQIIIREAIKREALGQPLCEEYKQQVQSCENYSKFDQECRQEVKRMQSEKIVTAFKSSDYVVSFRIYAGELTMKFEMTKKRRMSSTVI